MLRTALLLFATLLLAGCESTGYLLHVTAGQGKILLGRVDLEDELAKKDLPAARRKQLEVVAAVRRFAVERVGLVDAGYGTVFDTEGGPAVWNISACRDDAFVPYRWSFPIVGTVPYKGYFDKKLVEREAKELRAKNMDVMVYGASAYSTLGWFEDPLFTSMLKMDEHDLVSTVIHELTHATIYVKGGAEFNETLATFVGNQGALDFYREVDGKDSKRARLAEDSFHDDGVFAQGIGALKKRLEAIYNKDTSREQKLAAKKAELDDFPRRYREEIRPLLRTDGFDLMVARRRLDNAQVLAMDRYHGDLDLFRAFHVKQGGTLEDTVKALAKLAAEADDPREALARAVR